jgi:hypothetical protein
VQVASELDIVIRQKCLRSGNAKLLEGQSGHILLNDSIQQATTDHKLFIKEALLPEYFMCWRATGGENMRVDLTEEEQTIEDEMIAMWRHPRERVPFFVYLGREMAAEDEPS